MKKRIGGLKQGAAVLAMAAGLLLAAGTVSAESTAEESTSEESTSVVYVCEQQGFTIEYEPYNVPEWQDGNGVVIYTDQAGYIPYAMVWCGVQGDVEDEDPADYISQYTQSMQESYGDRLLNVEEGIEIQIDGSAIPGARFQYLVQDTEVELMVFFQKTEDSIRQFTAKYIVGEEESAIAAMAKAIRSFRLTDASGTASSDQTAAVEPDTTPAAPADSSLDVSGFTMMPISWDGVSIGKMGIPNGYYWLSEVHCSDESTCMGSPLRLSLTALSGDGTINMSYNVNESYIDRVSTSYGVLIAAEGELDGQTAMFQKHYQTAEEYCDERAAAMNAVFWKEEPITFYDHLVEQHYEEYYSSIIPQMPEYMSAQWCEVTAAQRVYTYEANGTTWALCIAAEVRGLQYKISYAGEEILTLWDVPGGYYTLTCPMEDFDRVYSTEFAAFMQNTSATDEFFALQEELSDQIRDQVINQSNMVTAQSMAYAAAMEAFMSESVNSYLSSSSYDTAARFSDYLFDENTYSTSDGYEVSISTAYDYVWEGSNGNIYYSQYATDMPYGATQLSPL